ncbi:hypothetical protein CINF_0288 [Candidatus Campylobacter infans]|uniref:Uncharacterized protein n=1 Tax=Candidatus Campylobacter infans TaxID=2561898 RepID=A0A7H9CHK6_9BACT|nr:hypothetical protein CINF_0288 [Candidatus Campylobacter infans]
MACAQNAGRAERGAGRGARILGGRGWRAQNFKIWRRFCAMVEKRIWEVFLKTK